MKTIRHLILTIAAAVIIFLLKSGGGVSENAFALESENSVSVQKTGTLTIEYKDDTDYGQKPVINAGFTIYKAGTWNEDGSYTSIAEGVSLDETLGEEEIKKIEKQSGEISGTYYCEINSQGVARVPLPVGVYLVKESSPAEGHLPSGPFLVSIPYTENGEKLVYDVTVSPKSEPCSDIVIEKKVTGTAGEKDREFHFLIEFGQSEPETAADSGLSRGIGNGTDENELMKFRADFSNGKKSVIRSGEQFSLKDGESIHVYEIPAGTRYKITETEADQNGYRTTAGNYEGNIKYGETISVVFENHRDSPPAVSSGKGFASPVKTGDESDIGKYLIIGISALLLCLWTVRRIRRELK